MSNNFVNDAIMGKYECRTCGSGVSQIPVLDEFLEWWNNLEDMIKYAAIAGVGLIAIVIVFSMFAPTKATGTEELEELLRLKMMKELAE